MFFFLVIFATVLIYIYVKVKYFSLRDNLPGVSPHIFFGNLIQSGILFHGATTAEVFPLFQRRFGDIFQFWLGTTRVIVVSNIADVQYIFLNRHIYDLGDIYVEKLGRMFPDSLMGIKGATYKRHAALIRPIFRRASFLTYSDIILDCVDQLLERWKTDKTSKVNLNIAEECQNLLFEIFGFVALDYHLEAFDNNKNENKTELIQSIRVVLSTTARVLQLPNFLAKIYLKFNSKYRQARSIIKHYSNEIIKYQLSQTSELIFERKRTSFIAALISSLQEDELTESGKSEEEKKGLSRKEMIEELIVFLIAGSDTSSSSLTWFIYHMSKHPQIQTKIKEELKNFCDDKRRLSIDHIESLIYLDAVIKEVFRISPPFDGTFRTLTNDDCLPHSGVQLYKDDQVYISFYNLSQNSRYWSIDPKIFSPERFLNEDKSHHPYAWIPFGGGHRQCMGQDFARFQLKLIIVRLMQHVTFHDDYPQMNTGGYVIRFSTIPKNIAVNITFD